jgi:hypothetical protein
LTLDDDVAVALRRLLKDRELSLKQAVNDALRLGLQQLNGPILRQPFSTATFDLGRCRVGSLDDVAEVLAIAEEETPA